MIENRKTQEIVAHVLAHSTEASNCMLRYQQKTDERNKALLFYFYAFRTRT